MCSALMNVACFHNVEDYYPIEKSEVELVNKDLWSRFHNLQNEMIITKSGRKMFPVINVRVAKLDPRAYYCIYLDMELESPRRLKYSSAKGWNPADNGEAQSVWKRYVHPDSPAMGDKWMSQLVSFTRLKLTNTTTAPPDQVVLSSMHKYQPRVVIVKSADINAFPPLAKVHIVAFPETQFVAVTAYQNEKITQLKIDNNPFAKGFRENGKSGTKRRKQLPDEEADDEYIDILSDDTASTPEPSPKTPRTDSPALIENPPVENGYYRPPLSLPPPPPAHYPPSYPFYLNYPFFYAPSFWPVSPFTYNNTSPNNDQNEQASLRTKNAPSPTKPRRRFADFSINTILLSN